MQQIVAEKNTGLDKRLSTSFASSTQKGPHGTQRVISEYLSNI